MNMGLFNSGRTLAHTGSGCPGDAPSAVGRIRTRPLGRAVAGRAGASVDSRGPDVFVVSQRTAPAGERLGRMMEVVAGMKVGGNERSVRRQHVPAVVPRLARRR